MAYETQVTTSPILAAAARVDNNTLAEGFARKAMATNAVLFAMQQRGTTILFTDFDLQAIEIITKTLDRVVDLSSPAKVPQGARQANYAFSLVAAAIAKSLADLDQIEAQKDASGQEQPLATPPGLFTGTSSPSGLTTGQTEPASAPGEPEVKPL